MKKNVLKPSQRYYLHRKIRECGYRVDARTRTVYVPQIPPPHLLPADVVKYFERLGWSNYNIQTEIS